MAILSAILSGVLLLILGTVLHSGFCLFQNYWAARKIGVPVRIILIDHVNPLWLVCDRAVLSVVRRLPFGLGNNSFTRYNYRGWEVPDRYYTHRELGDAYILVSPKNVWLYVADPDTVQDIWRRDKDFPRDTSVTEMLDIFGPSISTAQGDQWLKHRRITASSFNDQNNSIVWSEAVRVAHDMLHYWTAKDSIETAADDLRTLSLHIMSRAGFGQSFKFQGHDEKQNAALNEASMDFKESLKMILENCVLIFALGRKTLAKPWLPRKLRLLNEACNSFQKHMTQVYEEEKRAFIEHRSADRNLLTQLVRASQDEAIKSSLGGLTESEIYGDMFSFNFAGHDTTAHTFTFAIYFLAANPAVQDWISEEIQYVLDGRQPEDSSYSDFPRLKRCLAVMYETLRLYTPVPTGKIVNGQAPQSLTIGNKEYLLPAKTMVVPSYASLQTDPKYWGQDSLQWRPSRFVKSSESSELDDEQFITPGRGTFLAWSGGPRDCVGRKFSHVEFVSVMASLFRDWRVYPVMKDGEETPEQAHTRILRQIEVDSAPVLLLQMLHPERSPLVWKRR
ncbi:cytochrome P450 [Cryphonectria parasitica EP155]|uniref:Cytochrome P450 n=1 Tax=Cryphonectria parasitica (strain ATCC 38755 / EP155) TaxID=660469 RepID=A0A9P5CPS7_CRYP1|nr:cytochrome P450 [Cryphonectria parasitica EP155]KAF3765290.1 cytochrome P450 [Cryphonectria parasitica EP155]